MAADFKNGEYSNRTAEGRVSILVVDDVPANLIALEALLSSPKYEIIQATSGAQALKYLGKTEFAVALLDVQMPGVDGFELAEQVRASDGDWHTTPIIFLTATSPDDLDINRGYELGAVDYLLKPLNSHALKAKVFLFTDLYLKGKAQAKLEVLEREKLAQEKFAAELVKAQRQVVDILENTADGFIALDKEFQVIRVNGVQERISGLSREKTIGRSHWDIWPKETIPKIWTAYQKVIGERVHVSVEDYNSELKIWIAVDAYPTPDGGMAAFFRDVTKQKKLENDLIEREEQFRTIANSIPQLAWSANADGYITWYNERWYDYTGATPEEMAGWGWEAVHDPNILPKVLEQWKGAIESGNSFEMEFPLKSKTGDYRWFLTRVNPIRGAAGNIIRWFGTNTDIHDQRALREELARALAIRDEFMSMASHELRTPIASLKLQMQILLRQIHKGIKEALDPSNIQHIAESSCRQLDQLAHLIADMLDVTRISSGQLSVDLAPCDLTHTAKDAVSLFEAQFRTAGIPFTADFDSDVKVSGDSTRLVQVISNLLMNALKYGEGKEVALRVTKSGSHGIISVKDNGPGIAPEDINRIFARFERAVSERKISGLGLGLYISKQIVAAHGGTIHVETSLGKGSKFIVEIPLELKSKISYRLSQSISEA
jgi:PAS domain S-box-containing protein